MEDLAQKRRNEIDDLLSSTFNSILRIEEKSIDNRFTQGLSITEIHTIDAVGYSEKNPMNVIAARLDITLATLTVAVNRLVDKGLLARERDEADKRRVLISLTKQGKQVYRSHRLFHKHMAGEALSTLTEEEELVLIEALGKINSFFKAQAGENQ